LGNSSFGFSYVEEALTKMQSGLKPHTSVDISG
jgi:hypothetical protein